MVSDYLRINRTFLKYGANAQQNTFAGSFQFKSNANNASEIYWSDILKYRLVVILGEPGIGKTSEFESQHQQLNDAGELALYVRLEDLIKRKFSETVTAARFDEFKTAVEKRRRVYVFLDAVDEAKIRDYQGFEDALRHASESLRDYVQTAHIIISSRVRSWREQVDEDLIVKYLGLVDQPSKYQVTINANLGALKAEAKIDKSTKTADEIEKAIYVFELAPLSKEQFSEYARLRFLEAHRTEQLEDFLAAVNSQDAWAFARRPIDAEGLIQYWKERGKFDSLQGLIEADICRKLEEANPTHAPRVELSAADARFSVAALALGSILCRQPNLLTLEKANLYRRAEGAIDPRQILINLNHAKISNLLERPIFQSASFSQTQIFHRDYTDYLAADCLRQLSNENLSLGELNSLIFRSLHNSKFIPTSLRPVVAWLSHSLREVRSRVLKIDPMLLLEHGDSSILTDSERIELLNELSKDGHVPLKRINWRHIARLASESIASAINLIILDSDKTADVRELAISIAEYGRLKKCTKALLALAICDIEDSELRIAAILALKDLGAVEDLERLAAHQRKRRSVSAREAAAICRVCYPTYLNEADLFFLFSRVPTARSDSFHASWLEREIIGAVPRLDNFRLRTLVRGLTRLSRKRPWKRMSGPQLRMLSVKHNWFGDLLYTAIRETLLRSDSRELSESSMATAIEQLRIIRDFQDRFSSKEANLNAELFRHPNIRRKLFWNRVADRAVSGRQVVHRFQVNDTRDIWNLDIADIDWLLRDASHETSVGKQITAFRIAVQLAYASRDSKLKSKLTRIANAKNSLRSILDAEWPNPFRTWRSIATYKIKSVSHTGFIHRIRRKLHEINIWFFVLFGVLRYIAILGDLKSFPVLWNIYAVTRDKSASSRFGEIDIGKLNSKYGFLVSLLAQKAFKKFWRLYCPPLPQIGSGSTPNGAIVGLVGLELEFGGGNDFSTLEPSEAVIAAHHALHEMNGFPGWFLGLLKMYPSQVGGVLQQQISAEMHALASSGDVFGLLGDLAHHDERLSEYAKPAVWACLSAFEPPNLHILNYALSILLRGEASYREPIANIASARVNAANVNKDEGRLLVWLRVWLQVEAATAIDYLENYISRHQHPREFLAKFASGMKGKSRNSLLVESPSFVQFAILKRLIRLLYRYLNPRADVRHTGVYAPSIYDDAAEFRSTILRYLVESRDADVYAELVRLSEDPDFEVTKDRLLALAIERATADAESMPKTTFQVAQFIEKHHSLPQNQDELFDTIKNRLADLRELSENGDFSLRGIFGEKARESSIQKWVASSLEEASHGCYQISRELEVFDDKRPDIRAFRTSIGYVTIEIKIANDCNYRYLIQDALQDQLIGKYMRINKSRHGILLLVNLKSKKKWLIGPGKEVNFGRLTELLDEQAQLICEKRNYEIGLNVIGIDLSPVN